MTRYDTLPHEYGLFPAEALAEPLDEAFACLSAIRLRRRLKRSGPDYFERNMLERLCATGRKRRRSKRKVSSGPE